MLIAAVSDLHGSLPDIPDCDLLIIGGDICQRITILPGYEDQLKFLNGPFRKWLEALLKRNIPVVGIAGNHDTIFEGASALIPTLPWVYLQDSAPKWPGRGYHFPYDAIEKLGVKIWGAPWCLTYGRWSFMGDEALLAERFSLIPEDTDIVIAHGPPYGYGDLVPAKITEENEEKWPEPTHEGSHALLNRIKEIKPKLVVCGHIHDGYGTYKIDETIMVNAAVVDRSLGLVNSAVMIDLDLGRK